jgi:hypothetical protein
MRYWKPKLYRDVPHARNVLQKSGVFPAAIRSRPLFSDASDPESYEMPADRLDEVGSVELVKPTDKSWGGVG